jgi:sugar-specific transcriptional regulator TrmB
MIDDSTIKALERIGLSEGEAKLYIELLQLGPSSIAKIARTMRTSRQAIYLNIPRLLGIGLIKHIKYGQRMLYQTLPPSQLLMLADNNRSKLEQLMPMLTNMQANVAAVPLISVYDSPLSMREWYKRFLAKSQRNDEFLIYSTGNVDNWYQLDESFYKKYLEESKAKGVKFKILLPESDNSNKHQAQIGWSVDEYRYLPETLGRNVEQWIWQDEVCYLLLQGNSTNMIVLKSQPLAKFCIQQFNLAWLGTEITKNENIRQK